MPYLQLDVPVQYPLKQKQDLAMRLGRIYAEQMQADIKRVTVSIREFVDCVWRCSEGEPYPAALLMCDIRRGRPAEQRAKLAQVMIDACVEGLGLRIDQVNVEFTQHDGDEMFHPMLGGLSRDWSPEETKAASGVKPASAARVS